MEPFIKNQPGVAHIVGIGLGKRPNNKQQGHFDSVTVIELLAEAFLNSLRAVTGRGTGSTSR